MHGQVLVTIWNAILLIVTLLHLWWAYRVVFGHVLRKRTFRSTLSSYSITLFIRFLITRNFDWVVKWSLCHGSQTWRCFARHTLIAIISLVCKWYTLTWLTRALDTFLQSLLLFHFTVFPPHISDHFETITYLLFLQFNFLL